MSRYMERSDGILRMLKINYASSQDDIQNFSWEPVLRIFTFLPEETVKEMSTDTRGVLQFMVLGKDNPNSVLNIVTMARENGRSVQDHITKEMWQCLNEFYHSIRNEGLTISLKYDDPVSVLDNLIKNCLLYFGTTDVTMARGEGNAFINIGKHLERAIQSSDILDIKFSNLDYNMDSIADPTYWKYLLMSISGYQIYLKTYQGGFEAKNVLEQILLNDMFPRSVIYSINRLQRYFEKLKNEQNAAQYNEINFLIGKLKSRVQFSTTVSINAEGLQFFLSDIKDSLYVIGDTLNRNYFTHS